MTTIIELTNTNTDNSKRILMEMFKKGVKVAETDISDMTTRQLKQVMELQAMQKRVWCYKTIKVK